MLMNANTSRPRQQRQVVALIALFAILAVVLWIQVLPMLGSGTPRPAPVAARPAPAPAPPPASPAARGRRPGTSRAAAAKPGAPLSGVEEVHLAQLKETEPEPIDSPRNPFAFG